MKKVEWINPDKMYIETAHSTFNYQTKTIHTGNVWADTQHSSYIRGYEKTDSGRANQFEKGHLRNCDLSSFFGDAPQHPLSEHVKQVVRELTQGQESVVLYEFRHWRKGRNGTSQKVVHGWVITSYGDKLLRKIYANNSRKSMSVVDECAKYVGSDYDEAGRLVPIDTDNARGLSIVS